MQKIIVSDSSTLILMQKIDLLELLINKFKFIISQEVYKESVVSGKNVNSADSYKIENKIKNKSITVKEVINKSKCNKIMEEYNIGVGEAESIALFLQERADILAVDDHKGINISKIYGIPFMTALTFVVSSSKMGVIKKNDAKKMIEKLGIHGRYKNELIYKAFNYIGEKNE